LKEYGTNTPRMSTLLSILKLGGIIIVIEISIHTDSPNNQKIGKDSKRLLRCHIPNSETCPRHV